MDQDLLKLAQQTAERIEAAGHKQAGNIGPGVTWAAWNLEAAGVGFRMLRLLGSKRGRELMELFEASWEVLEVAGMSLGFGDAVTALDLCADALYLAAGGVPAPKGQFKDVGYWKKASRAGLPQECRRWIDDLLADKRWEELFWLWRAGITHRRFRRDIAVTVSEPSGEGSRALSRIEPPGGLAGGGADVLTKVDEMLEFAREQFRLFCAALAADYG